MRVLFFIWMVLFQFSTAFAQNTEVVKPGFQQDANQLLQTSISENKFVGVTAGFSIDSTIVWAAGAGYSNSDQKTAFTEATLTRIASLVKPMTAIAIMQLYEQNKIDLDKAIQEYIPDFPVKKAGAITVRQLLSHTSGIAEYQSDKERENKKEYPTLKDATDIFKDRDLTGTPGAVYQYSTYGYVVLGLIIEKVSGMTYENYMQKNIWDKAGMAHTGIEHYGKNYPGKSELYHKNNKGKIKSQTPTNLSDRVPGGGIYSCLTDMLKFGRAVINNDLIKANTLEEMLQNPGIRKEGNPYGFGWFLYGENPKYGNVFGHGGAQTGASAQMMILPKEKTAIVVLSNTSGANQEATNLSIQLFDIAAAANQERG